MDDLASIFESKLRKVMTMKDDFPNSTEPAQFKQDKHTIDGQRWHAEQLDKFEEPVPIDLLTAIDNLLDTCENKGMYHHEDCKNVREALANLKHESGLISAIEDIYKMMDEGILVRNTDQDASPQYYTRSLQFVQRLAKGKQAVDNAKTLLDARKLVHSARGLSSGMEGQEL